MSVYIYIYIYIYLFIHTQSCRGRAGGGGPVSKRDAITIVDADSKRALLVKISPGGVHRCPCPVYDIGKTTPNLEIIACKAIHLTPPLDVQRFTIILYALLTLSYNFILSCPIHGHPNLQRRDKREFHWKYQYSVLQSSGDYRHAASSNCKNQSHYWAAHTPLCLQARCLRFFLQETCWVDVVSLFLRQRIEISVFYI